MAETEMTGEDIAGNYRLPENALLIQRGLKHWAFNDDFGQVDEFPGHNSVVNVLGEKQSWKWNGVISRK